MKTITCPLCKTIDARLVDASVRDLPAAKVLRCDNCGLVYLNLETDKDGLQEYYAQQYRKDYGPDTSGMADAKKLFTEYVGYQSDRRQRLVPYLHKKASLLDVGCSAGQFLYNVKDDVGKVAGVELDPAAAAHAASVCACEVFPGYLSQAGYAKESFDIITAFQVLEHTPDPMAFIEELKEYLKPGGILCIEVPNLDDALLSAYDASGYRAMFFRKAHLTYFSKDSLRWLMSAAELEGEIFYSQDYNLFNHINWLNNNHPQKNGTGAFDVPQPVFLQGPVEEQKAQDKLKDFFAAADAQYRELLCELGLSAKIGFLARKKV